MDNNVNALAAATIVDIFSTGDLDKLSTVIAPSYFDHQGLGGKPIQGQAGFQTVVTVARQALPQLRVTILDIITESDKVVLRLDWNSHNSTGKTIRRETIEILRFVNGQAVEHWGAEAWVKETNGQE